MTHPSEKKPKYHENDSEVLPCRNSLVVPTRSDCTGSLGVLIQVGYEKCQLEEGGTIWGTRVPGIWTEAPSQGEDKLDVIHWVTTGHFMPAFLHASLQGSRWWDHSETRGARAHSSHLAPTAPTPRNQGRCGGTAYGSDPGNREGGEPSPGTTGDKRALPSEAISAKFSSITSRYKSL